MKDLLRKPITPDSAKLAAQLTEKKAELRTFAHITATNLRYEESERYMQAMQTIATHRRHRSSATLTFKSFSNCI